MAPRPARAAPRSVSAAGSGTEGGGGGGFSTTRPALVLEAIGEQGRGDRRAGDVELDRTMLRSAAAVAATGAGDAVDDSQPKVVMSRRVC